jgi:two-component system phosphate regulon response regulator PhoB
MEENQLVGKRLLLVEDDRAVREMLKTALSENAYTVVEANNGAEAFGLFRNGRFDLVMVDFEMPFLKGDELAARIKKLAPWQPILMITGHGKRPGPENPVDVVLNKPIDLDQLTAMAKLVSEARKSLAAQTSLTTASCQNKEIHSCAAKRSSFEPPFNSSLPSR